MANLLSPALLLASLQRVARHVREIIGGDAAEALVHGWAWPQAVIPLGGVLLVAERCALMCLAVGGEGGGLGCVGRVRAGGVALCGHFVG